MDIDKDGEPTVEGSDQYHSDAAFATKECITMT